MEAERTLGCSMRLNQPTNKVSQRRGMRLVSRKFKFSCWTTRSIKERVIIVVSFACNTVPREEFRDLPDTLLRCRRMRPGRSVPQAPGAAATVARQASVPGRTLAHGAPLRVGGAVLRIRR